MMIRRLGQKALAFVLFVFCGAAAVKTASSLSVDASMPGTPSVRYAITDLGTLPGGHYSRATAINNKGQIVGWADTGATKGVLTAHAFLWQDGKMGDIDTLSDHQTAPGTEAWAINDQSEVVGCVNPETEPNTILAYQFRPASWVWRNGVMQVIGSEVTAINSKGQATVIGGYSPTTQRDSFAEHTLIWQSGKSFVLPMPRGYQSMRALSINDSGAVVGACSDKVEDEQAFLYEHGKVRLLGTFPGFSVSRALAINGKGQVLGTANLPVGKQNNASAHAFVWDHGRMTDIGDAGVSGISDQGQVVGGYFVLNGSQARIEGAFLWQNGKVEDLSAEIDKGQGWNLEVATAINKGGQIVGYGEHDSQQHAFLLTPAPWRKI